jgi:hypothetical protein|tara:strand:+ start:377 stop:625 length:249 start_codon:yes stop_codon:yes gene_type:complete
MPAKINVDRVRELAKGFLRKEREPLLAEQDVKFQRSLEEGSDTSDIVAEKQRLRDITKLADEVNEATEKETLDKLASLNCVK